MSDGLGFWGFRRETEAGNSDRILPGTISLSESQAEFAPGFCCWYVYKPNDITSADVQKSYTGITRRICVYLLSELEC
jgi:hypothetical protein